jgi:hypothetical protein
LFIKPGVVGHASTSELACTICWFLYHSSTHTDAFSGSLVSSHFPRCSFRGTLSAAKLWKIYAHSPLSFPFPHDPASLRCVHSHIPNSLGEPSSAFFNPHSAFACISSFEFREISPRPPKYPPFRIPNSLRVSQESWHQVFILGFRIYQASGFCTLPTHTNSIPTVFPTYTQPSTIDSQSLSAAPSSPIPHPPIYLQFALSKTQR